MTIVEKLMNYSELNENGRFYSAFSKASLEQRGSYNESGTENRG